MAWIYLFLAGIMEVIWAVGLKYSDNFSKFIPTVVTISALFLSLWFLSLSLRTLPIGTAYAIWTGIGIIGTFIFGVVCFAEPLGIIKIISFLLIVLGILGLKLFA